MGGEALGGGTGKEGELGTVVGDLGILSGTLWRVAPRLGKEALSQ